MSKPNAGEEIAKVYANSINEIALEYTLQKPEEARIALDVCEKIQKRVASKFIALLQEMIQ